MLGATPALHRCTYLSHARWQQAYSRATSSSALSVLARRRDCARREPASSTRGGGRFEFWVGRSERRACSICRLIFVECRPRCEAMRHDAKRCATMLCVGGDNGVESGGQVEPVRELSRRQVQLYWQIWGRRGSGCPGCDTRARAPPLSAFRPAIYLKRPAACQRN